jgi:Tat protein secretion system quality control protein TatD with DNase activity
MFATVGCHPTRSLDFEKHHGGPQAYLAALDKVLANNAKGRGRAVAVGECGLGIYYTSYNKSRRNMSSPGDARL